jgi:hypothetical protein
MDNNAVVPENLMLDAEPIEAVEKQAVTAAHQEDAELAALYLSSGWKRLVKDMQADIALFKTGGFIKHIDTLALDEVGKLFVIHQTVATFLQKYLDKVESAAKAVADAERAK